MYICPSTKYLVRDRKKELEELMGLLSLAKALGGTKTKVIRRVIKKSQRASGNATYSISLRYGIYRRKKTDKQRA